MGSLEPFFFLKHEHYARECEFWNFKEKQDFDCEFDKMKGALNSYVLQGITVCLVSWGGGILQGITLCLVSTILSSLWWPGSFQTESRGHIHVFFKSPLWNKITSFSWGIFRKNRNNNQVTNWTPLYKFEPPISIKLGPPLLFLFGSPSLSWTKFSVNFIQQKLMELNDEHKISNKPEMYQILALCYAGSF